MERWSNPRNAKTEKGKTKRERIERKQPRRYYLTEAANFTIQILDGVGRVYASTQVK
jgi:hypothetical protein